MRRFCGIVALLAILLAGCRIEQTPAEYIDVLEIPQDDLAASQAELTDRLLSTALSLQRRNLNDLLAALLPAPDVVGYGPGEDQRITDPASLSFTLSEPTAGRMVSIEDLAVEVGPRNHVAWFRARYLVTDDADDPEERLFSGVFLRREGEWYLVQAHVSAPLSPTPPPSEAAADTPGGAG